MGGGIVNSICCFVSKSFRTSVGSWSWYKINISVVGAFVAIGLIYKRRDVGKWMGWNAEEVPRGVDATTITAGVSKTVPMAGETKDKKAEVETKTPNIQKIENLLQVQISLNNNKEFMYDLLTKEERKDTLNQSITVHKKVLGNREWVKKIELFVGKGPTIQVIDGTFSWSESTKEQIHWTADFADSDFLKFCPTFRLAQEEIVCVEHPQLYHLYKLIQSNADYEHLRKIEQDETILLQGVLRMGALDTTTTIPRLRSSLYGNNFQRATEEEMSNCTTPLVPPTQSNIFAIVAKVQTETTKTGKPYTKVDLEDMFYSVFNAFEAIVSIAPKDTKVVIHTGNWGTGAFGNSPKAVYLLQMAAAYAANIGEIRIYPMEYKGVFEEARILFEGLIGRGSLTVDNFIGALADNAQEYKLFYGTPNKT